MVHVEIKDNNEENGFRPPRYTDDVEALACAQEVLVTQHISCLPLVVCHYSPWLYLLILSQPYAANMPI